MNHRKKGDVVFQRSKIAKPKSIPLSVTYVSTANELPSGSATPEAPSWPAADGFATNDDDGLMSDIKLRRGKA
jgi:hypothetical protein